MGKHTVPLGIEANGISECVNTVLITQGRPFVGAQVGIAAYVGEKCAPFGAAPLCTAFLALCGNHVVFYFV